MEETLKIRYAESLSRFSGIVDAVRESIDKIEKRLQTCPLAMEDRTDLIQLQLDLENMESSVNQVAADVNLFLQIAKEEDRDEYIEVWERLAPMTIHFVDALCKQALRQKLLVWNINSTHHRLAKYQKKDH